MNYGVVPDKTAVLAEVDLGEITRFVMLFISIRICFRVGAYVVELSANKLRDVARPRHYIHMTGVGMKNVEA